ncbi:cysteine hydrolase family protein [Microbaculum marinum]|uniref:Isochorismatase family protein n=1 Tax=Microbaculum marinum TaxID=1764581 RepID=A0AAW9RL18_9HYPH
MTVIQFPRHTEDLGTPLFVFLDLQQEYISDGRAYALSGRDPWWSNSLRLLDFARDRGLPVAHFRQLRREPFFNRATPFAEWIEEFRPRPHEMVFERSHPSCYSNDSFSTLLDSLSSPFFLLAGLTCESNCLSTIFDAHHRGHKTTLVSDASASKALGDHDEREVHEIVAEIAGLFCDVTSTSQIVSRYTGRKPSLAG